MGSMRSLLIPDVDKQLLVREAVKTMPDLVRHRFITRGASLGALTLLTGGGVFDSFSAEALLKKVSKCNDSARALIFNPNTLAPTFSESAITKPSRSNVLRPPTMRPWSMARTGKLQMRGLVDNKKSW